MRRKDDMNDLMHQRFGSLVVIGSYFPEWDGKAKLLQVACDCGRWCHFTRKQLLGKAITKCWTCMGYPEYVPIPPIPHSEYSRYYRLRDKLGNAFPYKSFDEYLNDRPQAEV